MGETLAIVSQKGGGGKTTTAICLAYFFGRALRKTLLLDLDPQNALAFGTLLPGSESKTGIFNVIVNRGNIDEVIYSTKFDNVDVIPFGAYDLSPSKIEGYFSLGSSKIAFDKILTELLSRYEQIMIDSPSGGATMTKFALLRADSVIIPIQCQPLALRVLPGILKNIKEIKAKANAKLKVAGILLTMFDYLDEISEQVAGQIWSHFPEEIVFKTVVPRSDKFQLLFTHDRNPLLGEELPEEILAYDVIAEQIINAEKVISSKSG